MNRAVLFLLMLSLLTACFQEDEVIPVEKRQLPQNEDTAEGDTLIAQGGDTLLSNPGVRQTAQFSIGHGPEYPMQVFFDLSSGTYQSQSKYEWDLAFPLKEEDPIQLNDSKYAALYATGETTWSAVSSTKGYSVEYFIPKGSQAKSPFGDWTRWGKQWSPVFIYDRGLMNESDFYPDTARYYKLRIKRDGSTFRVQAMKIESMAQPMEFNLQLSETHPYAYLSVVDGVQSNYAPPAPEWDLLFTRYIHEFEEEDAAFRFYLVSGVLLNPSKVEALEYDGEKTFGELSIQDVFGLKLSRTWDVIGYDWKEYIFENGGSWRVYPERIFVIQDADGYHYKLRFTGWKDAQGNTGLVTMDYQRL